MTNRPKQKRTNYIDRANRLKTLRSLVSKRGPLQFEEFLAALSLVTIYREAISVEVNPAEIDIAWNLAKDVTEYVRREGYTLHLMPPALVDVADSLEADWSGCGFRDEIESAEDARERESGRLISRVEAMGYLGLNRYRVGKLEREGLIKPIKRGGLIWLRESELKRVKENKKASD